MAAIRNAVVVGAVLVSAGLVTATAGGGVFASAEGHPTVSVAPYSPPAASISTRSVSGTPAGTPSSTVRTPAPSTTAAPGRTSAAPPPSAGRSGSATSTPTRTGGPARTGSPAQAPINGTPLGPTTRNPKGAPARVYVFDGAGKTIVNATVIPTYLDSRGVLAPPPGVAGWYAERGWVPPGKRGTSVLTGHVSWNGVPDTFYNLPRVTPGNRILVRYTSGDQVAFVATGSRGESKSAVPKDTSIWSPTSSPSLRLITCDPRTPMRGGHFEGNWVVWARPA